MDETGADGSLAIRYPMVGKAEARRWESATDYADEATPLDIRATWEWNHGLGEVLGSLLGAGMRLAWYREHPYLSWRSFPAMIEIDEYFYGLPAHLPAIPLAYSLKAVRE
jgi:hypothetical protein